MAELIPVSGQLAGLSLGDPARPGLICSFPPELVLRILEVGSEDDTTINFSKRRKLLTRTALVCKQWGRLSKLLLLSKIYLDETRSSGPKYESVLAALDDQPNVICQRMVLKGGIAQGRAQAFDKMDRIDQLDLLSCAIHDGIGPLFRLQGLQNVKRLSVTSCSVTEIGAAVPRRVACSYPTQLVHLKLGQSWWAPWLVSELEHLIVASASNLRHLSVHVDPDLAPLHALRRAVEAASLGLRTLALVLKSTVAPGFDIVQLVDACSTIDTLAIEYTDSRLVTFILADLDPDVKLKRLVVNLRKGLFTSAEEVRDWLVAPSLAGLEVLVLRGSRHKAFGELDEAKALLEFVREQGIKQVFLRKG